MAGIWSLYEEAKYDFVAPLLSLTSTYRSLDKRAVFTASFFGELD
jgi:hypothetical protein